jgi:hypothetical protein
MQVITTFVNKQNVMRSFTFKSVFLYAFWEHFSTYFPDLNRRDEGNRGWEEMMNRGGFETR